MIVSIPGLLPINALRNIHGQVSLSTCVRGAAECVPRGGMAGVWGIRSPPWPRQFTLLLGPGLLGPCILTTMCLSDASEVELAVPRLSFSSLAALPSEESDAASSVPCTPSPLKTRGSNGWVTPHLITCRRLCAKRHRGHSQLGEGWCVGLQTCPGVWPAPRWPWKFHPYRGAEPTHRLQLARPPPLLWKWKRVANSSHGGEFVWVAVLIPVSNLLGCFWGTWGRCGVGQTRVWIWVAVSPSSSHFSKSLKCFCIWVFRVTVSEVRMSWV